MTVLPGEVIGSVIHQAVHAGELSQYSTCTAHIVIFSDANLGASFPGRRS